MAIAEARLDAELADDDAAFAAAVDAELEAWSSRIDALHASAAATKQHARAKREAAILRVRERRAAAQHQLQAFRKHASTAASAQRAEVNRAMDDLDRAAEQAAAEPD